MNVLLCTKSCLGHVDTSRRLLMVAAAAVHVVRFNGAGVGVELGALRSP